MKTFETLAAIFGLAMGFALAGPLDRTETHSMCEIECQQGNGNLKFETGKTYAYRYEGGVSTDVGDKVQRDTTMSIKADVLVHAISPCRLVLEVKNTTMFGRKDQNREYYQDGIEINRQMSEYALAFNYENGMISRLCPSSGDSSAVLNMKRGILSMLQNSIGTDSETHITQEQDVHGRCPTRYSQTGASGDRTRRFNREKTLSECERQDGQQIIGAIAIPRVIAKSSSLINGTQNCEGNVVNSVLKSVVCTERYAVRPFKRQEAAAVTEVKQTLHLNGLVGSRRPANTLVVYESQQQSLEFDTRDEAEANEIELKKQLTTLLYTALANSNTAIKISPSDFSKMVNLIRQMKYVTLKQVIGENSEQLLVDALLSSMSSDSMKLVIDMIEQRRISDSRAKVWLMKAALATDVDLATFLHMKKLLVKDSLMMEAHLAVSSIGRTHLEENPAYIPAEIESLVRKWHSDLRSEKSEQKLMAILKAIGNIGLSVGDEEQILEVTRQKTLEVRLAAVEAFRRFSCAKYDRKRLWELFTDASEQTEVRVGAYLNSIVCPTPEMVESLRSTLLKEPKDSEMASFVFTHLKNLQKRSSWTFDVDSVTSDKDLSSFDKDSSTRSRNYFYELFFNPLDMGFETDAGSIFSMNGNTFMLNATFDMFGSNVNLFDTRVRVSRDMTSFDGFLRFFGKEIMYKNVDTKKSSELRSLLDSVMSASGLHFSRSMTILDTRLVLPTGMGLPLTLGVQGVSTMSLKLKASPVSESSQKLNMVADLHAAPSAAVEFQVVMGVKYSKFESGIRMTVTSSSQWDVSAQLKMDMTAPALFKIEMKTPRDRSDLINIETNVYLIGTNSEEKLTNWDADQKEWKFCSGETLHKAVGHTICLDASLPSMKGKQGPLSNGNGRLSIYLMKTDRSLSNFELEASVVSKSGIKDEVVLSFNTPGSQIDRHMKGRLYNNVQEKTFGLELLSPVKKLTVGGSYSMEETNRHINIEMKEDEKTKMIVKAGLARVSGRSTVYTPTLEISMGSTQIVDIKSELSVMGNQNIHGDIEIKSAFTEQPININGKYSGNDKKEISLSVSSKILSANVLGRLAIDGRTNAISAEGDYNLQGKGKQSFGLQMKAMIHEDYPVPQSIEASLDVNGKQYSTKLSNTKEGRESSLLGVVEWDSRRYATNLRYNLDPNKAKFNLKIELPEGVERNAKISFARNNNAVKLSAMTDFYGKLYNGVVSYVPQEGKHKLSADLKIDEHHFQLDGLVGYDTLYQFKVDLSHNESKLLGIHLGASKELKQPKIKASIIYRQKMILDATSEAVFESRGASILFDMRSPMKLNGNVAVKKIGTLNSELKLETTAALTTEENLFDFDLSSKFDISLFGDNKKANADMTFTLSKDKYKLVTKNLLNPQNWKLVWQLETPRKDHGKLTSSNSQISTLSARWNMENESKQKVSFELTIDDLTVSSGSFNYMKMGSNYLVDSKLSGKWNQIVVDIQGKVENSHQGSLLNIEYQIPIKTFSSGKVQLQRQLVSRDTSSFNAKLSVDEHFMNGELTVSPSMFEAIVRTSIKNWESMKASASWERQPHTRLTMNLHTPLYENNVAEIEITTTKNVQFKGRLAIPRLHADQLVEFNGAIEGNLKNVQNKGKIIINYRSQQKIKMIVETTNEENSKRLVVNTNYNFQGEKESFKLEVDFKKTDLSAYDTKVVLFRNNDRVVDVSHSVILKLRDGIFIENELEAKTSLFEEWNGIWAMNKFMLRDGRLITQHEIGTSSKNVIGSFKARGELLRESDVSSKSSIEMKWRDYKYSAEGELRRHSKSHFESSLKVETHQGKIVDLNSRLIMNMVPFEPLAEIKGQLEIPQMMPKTEIHAAVGYLESKTDKQAKKPVGISVSVERDENQAKYELLVRRSEPSISFTFKHFKWIKLNLEGNVSLESRTANLSFERFEYINDSKWLFTGKFDWTESPSLELKLVRPSGKVNAALFVERQNKKLNELKWKIHMENEVSGVLFKGKLHQYDGEIILKAKSDKWTPLSEVRFSVDSTEALVRAILGSHKLDLYANNENGMLLQGVIHKDGERFKQGHIKIDLGNKKISFGLNFGDDGIPMNFENENANTGIGGRSGELWWKARPASLDVTDEHSEQSLTRKFLTKLSWEDDLSAHMYVSTSPQNRWRIEAKSDFEKNGKVKVDIFLNDQAHAQYNGNWNLEKNVLIGAEFIYMKEKQFMFEFENAKNPNNLKLKLYLDLSPALGEKFSELKISSLLTSQEFSLDMTLTNDGTTHAFQTSGKINGSNFSGSFQIRCPIFGNHDGTLEGQILNEKITFVVKTQTNELNGEIDRENGQLLYKLKTRNGEHHGKIYWKNIYGYEIEGNPKDFNYKLVNLVEPYKSYIHLEAVEGYPRIEYSLKKINENLYRLSYKNDNVPSFVVEWTLKGPRMLAGEINYILQDKTPTKYVTIEYDFVQRRNLKITKQGQTVFEIDIKHQRNQNRLEQNLYITLPGIPKTGYSIVAHQNIYGSAIRVNLMGREFVLKMDNENSQKGGANKYSGVFGWDYSRDQQKVIEITMNEIREKDGRVSYEGSMQARKFNKEIFMRMTQVDDVFHMTMSHADNRRNHVVDIKYSKKGKLEAKLGEFQMEAEYSSKAAKLRIIQAWSKNADLDIGYEIIGRKTLSLGAQWRPQLVANSLMAFKNLVRETGNYLGGGNMEYLDSEIRSVSDDFRHSTSNFLVFYEADKYYIATLSSSVSKFSEDYMNAISKWMESVEEKMSEVYRGWKKWYAFHSVRFSIVSTIVATIVYEKAEDVTDIIKKWIQQNGGKPVQRLVQRSVEMVRERFEGHESDVIEYFTDNYLCEYSKGSLRLNNKKCGLGYELESKTTQGFAIRLPLGVSY